MRTDSEQLPQKARRKPLDMFRRPKVESPEWWWVALVEEREPLCRPEPPADAPRRVTCGLYGILYGTQR